MPLEIMNAQMIWCPPTDSQYCLVKCSCGNDQPVYVLGDDGEWRVMCLECKKEVKASGSRHEAQVAWNKNTEVAAYDGNQRQRAV